VRVLFGSILGLSTAQASFAAVVAVAVVALLLTVARPLLFASIDEAVSGARGVPVRALGVGFLLLVGLTAAETTQAVGALLLLGLMAAPAGAAHKVTDRPYPAMALAAALSMTAMVVGLVIANYVP